MDNRIAAGIFGLLGFVLIFALRSPSLPPPPPSGEFIPSSANLTSCERKLQGMDFSAGEAYEGVPAPVKFDDKDPRQYDPGTRTFARTYRTRIAAAAASGANYAGSYAVASWGLGNGPLGGAVVNVRSGEIVAYGLRSHEMFAHATSSSLLILNPKPRNPAALADLDGYRSFMSGLERAYYRMEGDKLVLLCTENGSEGL